MIINSNIPSLNSHNKLSRNENTTTKASARLSSGLKINTAADDAAGLAISEKMRAQIRGLYQAERNVRDGVSIVQTAEGGLSEITNIVQRQRELIIQGLNDTNTDDDRKKIDEEILQLKEEINALAEITEFNNMKLLSGDYAVLEDRSSHSVGVTQKPLPPSVTSTNKLIWLPAGTADQPKHETVPQSTVEYVTNNYSHSASSTNFEYDDGRPGLNEYEKSIYTETKTTAEIVISESLSKDSNYTTLQLSGSVSSDNLYCTATKTNPDKTSSNSNVPTIGLPTTNDIDLIIDGTVYDTSEKYTNFTTIENTSSSIVRAVVFGDIEFTESFTLNSDNSYEVTFTLKNLSVTNNHDIDLNLATIATGLGFNFSYPSGLQANTNYSNGDITATGTLIHYANEYMEYDLSFAESTGSGDVSPSRFYSNEHGGNTPECSLLLEWGANLDAGEEVAFGFKYTNVNFKQEVYRQTEYTETLSSDITVTTTTDIKDVDYGIPTLYIQAGADESQFIRIPLYNVGTERLGITDVGLLPPYSNEQSIGMLDEALTRVSNIRTNYGALQNRMEYTINDLAISSENLVDAESRIRDTDMAKEMIAFTKSNVLNNAAIAMITQANQQPQMVLRLLNL